MTLIRTLHHLVLATVLLAGSVATAAATPRALVLVNDAPAASGRLADVTRAAAASQVLEDAGFVVHTARNADVAQARAALARFLSESDDATRLVIVLAGQFAQGATTGWFLGADAARPGLGEIAGEALPLSLFLDAAGRLPGGGIVVLSGAARAPQLGAGLAPGAAALAIPQGVTLLRMPPERVTDNLRGMLAEGRSLSEAVAGLRDAEVSGFVSPLVTVLPERRAATGPDPAEERAWQEARTADTAAAYESYLSRFPGGVFAGPARDALTRLRDDPQTRAREAEEALALTRDQRREVQRALSVLGYNTRGIDGIFGPGTRGAITQWQGRSGFPETGFLDRPQLSDLGRQADRRAAELEEEARARQAALEAEDRAFWQRSGADGSEAGLRAYLRAYPDGLFADIARTRVALYEEERRNQAAGRDRAAWDAAEAEGSLRAYRRYLRDWPEGAFAEMARARIEALEEDGGAAADREAAIREEEALGLTPFTRNLIEQRLLALGLNPGRVDGVFDDSTRRAIRQYQRARGLPATGYLTERTVSQLLVDSMRGFLRQ